MHIKYIEHGLISHSHHALNNMKKGNLSKALHECKDMITYLGILKKSKSKKIAGIAADISKLIKEITEAKKDKVNKLDIYKKILYIQRQSKILVALVVAEEKKLKKEHPKEKKEKKAA